MSAVIVTTVRGEQVNASIEAWPDECPVCHSHVHPQELTSYLKYPALRRELEIVFRCTREECQAVFIAYYRGLSNSQTIASPERYQLSRTAPVVAVVQEFSQEIKELSPNFAIVYNQAIAAEAAGLDQMTGIGLRKALEFLIKDLAARLKPDAKEEIEKALLGPCIAKFIEDANLRECARRAAWLGNDETHYVRRWEDKDITDLKRLVRLTVNWAENVILTQRYIEEMPA